MPVYGLLGYPLLYSLSPAMHNAAFCALGIDAHYDLWPTHSTEVNCRVSDLRNDQAVGGFNITVPHKQAMVSLLDDISPAAQAVGAVNTVTKRGETLNGQNTDIYGFQQMLREAGVPVQGQQVLVLGAGGAARAVVYALLQIGVDKVWMLNRTPEKAAHLLQDLQAGERGRVLDPRGRFLWVNENSGEAGQPPAPTDTPKGVIPNRSPVVGLHSTQGRMQFCPYKGLGDISVVINATSSEDPWSTFGLAPDQVWPTGNGWAVDLMYGNMLAGFLDQARSHGWYTLSGEGMLLHQAAKAFELWTGQDAPVEVMRSALMEALRR